MATRADARLRIGTWLAAVFAAVAAISCQDQPIAGVPAGVVAALNGVGSSELVGAVSQPLERPLQVEVVNAGGGAVAGATVNWRVTAGGGSVSPATSTTDLSGRATTTWTLGPLAGAATDTATASVEDLPPVIFTATGAQPATGVWRSLGAAVNHTCGLTTAGAFYCWGDNFYGEYGNGTTITSPVPTVGATGLVVASFGLGQDYTCVRTPAGTAYCFGTNSYGQFGDGLYDVNPLNPARHPTPVPVSGNLLFAGISTGTDHACGVTAAGAAYCWGWNGEGEVGDGTTICKRFTPTHVLGNLTFALVSAATSHSCGVTADGRAYCWGDAQLLGDGTGLPSPTPVPVAGKIRFVSLTAGTTHTCALDAGGAAYCWGLNSSGEVGDGTAEQRFAPVPVTGGLAFANISAGYYHTCGVSKAGVAYCWGNNDAGALGVGDTIPRLVPTPVRGGVLFAGVSAGLNYTCGWSSAGGAFCWGSTSALGDGFSIRSLVPVRVVGP